jgi:hypothetical protein
MADKDGSGENCYNQRLLAFLPRDNTDAFPVPPAKGSSSDGSNRRTEQDVDTLILELQTHVVATTI